MKRGKRKPRASLMIVGIIIILIGVGALIFAQYNKAKMEAAVNINTIYNGISIDGIDISGETRMKAVTLIQDKLDAHISTQIVTLNYGDRSWKIPFMAIDAKYDVIKAVQKAWEVGRKGELKERYKIVMDLQENKLNMDIEYSYDKVKMEEELKKIEQEFNIKVQESQLTRKGGRFIITDEKDGYDMDVPKTMEKVIALVESKKGGSIEPVIVVTKPKITRAANEKVTNLIGSFTTEYTAYAKDRNENIRVGCANINGSVIAPNDVFSANAGLGPQTYANGYKDAGVYVNGKVEQGVGGGVCQVTSTLYNAAILAELDIVERSAHSMTVGYVPLGRDAAVAGNYKDLKIKNNTGYPIYIEAYCGGGKLSMNIYGHEIHEPGRRLEFEKVHEETIEKPAEKLTKDAELPQGERKVNSYGKKGSKVSVYKKVFQNGKLISRELFSRSTYRATPDDVSIGTKPKGEATTASGKNQSEITSDKPIGSD